MWANLCLRHLKFLRLQLDLGSFLRLSNMALFPQAADLQRANASSVHYIIDTGLDVMNHIFIAYDKDNCCRLITQQLSRKFHEFE